METAETLTPADLRAARARLRLTQAELARRAGISRATLVNFEKGRGTPLRASLQALQSALSDRPRHKSRLAHVLRTLQKAQPELERRGVLHLAVFGSVARMEDTPESDIDIVVDIDPARRFDILDLAGIGGLVESLIGVPVDIVRRRAGMKPELAEHLAEDQIYAF
ncbi:nucleotidyltransferase domain-containing protein [Parvibaculum sp.]|uniref:nucleotidyltransferase domain-containing protein n=1 Tax=Parvibaculum sp. TaxID=2024848 RepID=UPI00273049D6|nr:XRE family transcriptional regulator [Parvibaculum sp.]MDP1626822.1 nucleotidyltransferase domain-containing protein [Parvibaculum sp.]MDP2148468.1 nucleotidyltransferase domain-containing protein [Parvibaculum sp.]MDP3329715.1 nucleotidyltransferase domain-containing protein [Parvibaculum sp.]